MNCYKNLLSLKNKTAFVVGGNGLIGNEISKALNSNECKVIILDINDHNIMHENGVIFRLYDCTNLDSIESNLKKIIDEFNVPDIFINCSYPRTEDWGKNNFEEISLNSFRKNIDIHLNSYSWAARIVANEMAKYKKRGSIIQLGSIYGLVGQDLSIYEGTDMKENMSYSIIKGGITNLTKQMASVYGKHEIRVNALCPGGVDDGNHNKKFLDNYSNKVPLGRLAMPNEIANCALFLSSDSSSYITGSTFMVDGGWTAI